MNGIFYLILRCFIKNGNESHSVEMKQTYGEAQKRFYSVLDADVNNNEIEYISAYIINCNGYVEDYKVIDRRTPVE